MRVLYDSVPAVRERVGFTLRFKTQLTRLLLPTLDRPTKTISGTSAIGSGRSLILEAVRPFSTDPTRALARNSSDSEFGRTPLARISPNREKMRSISLYLASTRRTALISDSG